MPTGVGADTFIAVTTDANGLLYGVTAPPLDGSGASLVIVDLRPELIAQEQAQGRGGAQGLSCRGAQASTLIITSPPINFHVTQFHALPSGHHLLLAGYSLQDDERAVVAVVDVHGGRLEVSQQQQQQASRQIRTPSGVTAGSAGSPRGGLGGANSAAAAAPGLRVRHCKLHYVDEQLLHDRPGLLIHQVAWHAHSDDHLLLLTSDNTLRLYSKHDLTCAEQTLRLQLHDAAGGSGGRFGLLLPMGAASGLAHAAAFGFGPALGWGFFTLFVLDSQGGIYALCPVAPFGMKVSSSVLQQVAMTGSSSSSSSGRSAPDPWMLAAFGSEAALDPTMRSSWSVLPHLLPEACTALQGPLNAAHESYVQEAGPSRAVALAVQHQLTFPSATSAVISSITDGVSPPWLSPGADQKSASVTATQREQQPSCISAIISAFTDGHVYAHALLQPATAPLQPAWTYGLPQCAVDEVTGHITAVRSQCEVVDPSSSAVSSTPAAAATAVDDGAPPGSLAASFAAAASLARSPAHASPQTKTHDGSANAWDGTATQAIADGRDSPQLLLLDLLEVPAPPLLPSKTKSTIAAIPATTASSSRACTVYGVPPEMDDDDSSDDGEEEEEEEAAANQRGGMNASGLVIFNPDSSASQGASGFGFTQGQQRRPLLSKRLQPPGAGLALLSSESAAVAHLWISHAGGCWAVHLPWLPLLPAALAAALSNAAQHNSTQKPSGTAAGFGSSSAAVMKQSLSLPRDVSVSLRQLDLVDLMEQLPPPVLREALEVSTTHVEQQQHSSGACRSTLQQGGGGGGHMIVSACMLHDVFLGTGVLLLQEPDILQFFTPPGVNELQLASLSIGDSSEESATTGAAAAAASPSGVAVQDSAATGSSSNTRQQQMEADLLSIYDELRKGPAIPQLPAPSGSAVEEGAASLSRLQTSISALRSTHVEFAHRAHHDLTERYSQLSSEAAEHPRSVHDLKLLAEEVEAKGAALQARLQRALQLQRNLAERAGLLTMLHWSLARPLSIEERSFSSELESIRSQQATLRATCNGLSKRAHAAVQAQTEASRSLIGNGVSSVGDNSSWVGLAGGDTVVGNGSSRGTIAKAGMVTGGGLTPAQDVQARALILSQYQALGAMQATLQRMEADVQRHQESAQAEAAAKLVPGEGLVA